MVLAAAAATVAVPGLGVLRLAVAASRVAVLGRGLGVAAVVGASRRVVGLGLSLLEAAAEDAADEAANQLGSLAAALAGGGVPCGLLDGLFDAVDDGIRGSAGDAVLEGQVLGLEVLAHLELAAAAVAAVLLALLVILTALDALAAQLLPVLVALVVVQPLPPLLHDAENQLATLLGAVRTHVALGRVVKHAVDDLVEQAVDIDIGVVPSFHDLRDDPSDDLRGGIAVDLVENLTALVSSASCGNRGSYRTRLTLVKWSLDSIE